jgi:D-alanyl-D-alanine carboxypeptidase
VTGIAALLMALALGPSPALRPLDLPPLPIAAIPDQAPPDLGSASWALYAVGDTGLLWEGNPDSQHPEASVTKVMTALLVVENTSPGEMVTVSAVAAATPVGYTGQMTLRRGEVWTVEQLLKDMLVQSDNAAAVALAEHVSGSVPAFLEQMNRKAGELGMTGTVFLNPNGLDTDGHVSTARDLILLGAAAVQEPRITNITRITSITFHPGSRTMSVHNTNRLIGVFPGILGLKTGDTQMARKVLLSYAEAAHDQFVAVVMGSDDHMRDTARLMAYAIRTRGPRDCFYRVLAGTETVASMPSWWQSRMASTPPLASPTPAPAAHLTPAERRLTAGLRSLLPSLMGGGE